jgi:hypothetical protein
MDIFFDVRKVPGLKKKPSTSELIDWLKLLLADDIPEESPQKSGFEKRHSSTVWCPA